MHRPLHGLNHPAAASRRVLQPPTRRCGFTLTELLVVVGAIGIMAAIAYPSYTDSVIRGKLTEAHAGLFTKRIELEQAFADTHTFVGAAACNTDSVTSNYFTFSCSVQTATTYTVQAVGTDSVVGFTFTIDHRNVKQTTAVPEGWSVPSPNNCWVLKRGGSC